MTANYVGNNTIHMINENINPAVFMGLGPCTIQTASGPVNYSTCSTVGNQNQRRILSLQNPAQGQYYGGVGAFDDGGTAEYEGLFLSAQKQLSHGVTAGQLHLVALHQRSLFIEHRCDRGYPSEQSQELSNATGIDLRQQFVLNLKISDYTPNSPTGRCG